MQTGAATHGVGVRRAAAAPRFGDTPRGPAASAAVTASVPGVSGASGPGDCLLMLVAESGTERFRAGSVTPE